MEFGLDMQVGTRATLGLSYDGQLASGSNEHGASGKAARLLLMASIMRSIILRAGESGTGGNSAARHARAIRNHAGSDLVAGDMG